jgi:hypothetical protein
MKKLICWLCILALLLCVLSFVGCTDDEAEGEGTPPATDATPAPEKETSDKDIINDNKTGNDDTAADIFS